ncbi:unnamed protein product, partial [Sphacelaria rigidula]
RCELDRVRAATAEANVRVIEANERADKASEYTIALHEDVRKLEEALGDRTSEVCPLCAVLLGLCMELHATSPTSCVLLEWLWVLHYKRGEFPQLSAEDTVSRWCHQVIVVRAYSDGSRG